MEQGALKTKCQSVNVHDITCPCVYCTCGAHYCGHMWMHNSVCISASSSGVAACVSVYSTHCTRVYIWTYAHECLATVCSIRGLYCPEWCVEGKFMAALCVLSDSLHHTTWQCVGNPISVRCVVQCVGYYGHIASSGYVTLTRNVVVVVTIYLTTTGGRHQLTWLHCYWECCVVPLQL